MSEDLDTATVKDIHIAANRPTFGGEPRLRTHGRYFVCRMRRNHLDLIVQVEDLSGDGHGAYEISRSTNLDRSPRIFSADGKYLGRSIHGWFRPRTDTIGNGGVSTSLWVRTRGGGMSFCTRYLKDTAVVGESTWDVQ